MLADGIHFCDIRSTGQELPGDVLQLLRGDDGFFKQGRAAADVYKRQTTGSRTPEKGYKNAPTYQAGKSVDDIGGGICQTSSTIYYAVLHTPLEVVERHDHQLDVYKRQEPGHGPYRRTEVWNQQEHRT